MEQESIQDLFTRTAARFPSHTAIDSSGSLITFSQLDARSNRLANFLLDNGLRPGALVASVAIVPPYVTTSILGIINAGAVFVPLDPPFPDKRLQPMSEQV